MCFPFILPSWRVHQLVSADQTHPGLFFRRLRTGCAVCSVFRIRVLEGSSFTGNVLVLRSPCRRPTSGPAKRAEGCLQRVCTIVALISPYTCDESTTWGMCVWNVMPCLYVHVHIYAHTHTIFFCQLWSVASFKKCVSFAQRYRYKVVRSLIISLLCAGPAGAPALSLPTLVIWGFSGFSQPVVLVFWGRHTKVLQTGQFQQSESVFSPPGGQKSKIKEPAGLLLLRPAPRVCGRPSSPCVPAGHPPVCLCPGLSLPGPQSHGLRARPRALILT